MLLNPEEVGSLTLIVAVMLPEALVLCFSVAFERIAGSLFLNTLKCFVSKKPFFI